jgi:endonuclease/exonuclease/phosphatase family metal-dependent hydrolase
MERLKALTLNIWNRQGPWEKRLPLIRSGIEALEPDVIGLQEVLAMEGNGSQAHEIAEGLGYHVAVFPAWAIGGGLTFCNAVMSRHPIIDSQTFPLPPKVEHESRSLGFALVDAPCGRVPVFVTHLSWKFHEGFLRVEQVKSIARLVKEHAPGGGFPPILMGDFNAEPDADEMRYLRGLTTLGEPRSVYFADVWDSVGEGEGFTYARANQYALRAREPSRRIDYIYVRGPDRQLRGEPLLARVVFDEPLENVYPSDHFGLYTELQAAPRPHDPF